MQIPGWLAIEVECAPAHQTASRLLGKPCNKEFVFYQYGFVKVKGVLVGMLACFPHKNYFLRLIEIFVIATYTMYMSV